MEFPKDLKATPWSMSGYASSNGSKGVVGITQFAQEQLGDVVFVELPELGHSAQRIRAYLWRGRIG